MKPITVTKKSDETLLDASKKAINQATINNRTVIFQDGNYTCLVYPNDVLEKVMKAFKRIALMIEIAYLESRKA
jgi:hypothetical protein